MKIDFSTLPSKALLEVNKVGSGIVNGTKRIFTKKDEFVKVAPETKFGKDTAIGASALTLATVLALKCIKGIGSKTKEIKNDDN